MRNIEGFLFFDRLKYTPTEQTYIFGKSKDSLFCPFQVNLETFLTPEKAAKAAKEYFVKFYDDAPNPIISKVKMIIPEFLKEEEELSKENELIIVIPQDLTGYSKLIGAPAKIRYCNSEVRASELIYNNLTPYYPIAGETSYKLASDARSEIARQCEQAGILIAKFSLRKHPDSQRLIHHPELT